MRSLYWKIFLFFWLTLIIAMSVVVALTGTIIDSRQKRESHEIIELAVKVTDTYEKKGHRALAKALRELDEEDHIRAFILDEQNRPVSRVNLPKDWLSFTQPLTIQRMQERTRRGLHAHSISSSSGRKYTFVAHVARNRGYQGWFPHLPALQLLTALAIVALFTAFITWRITHPLSRLKKATNAFALGKLSSRVDNRVVARKDEIGQLGSAFNNMAERISMLLSNQQRLFRDISHELRTPLSRQQIALELLSRKIPEQDQAGIARIEREINRMDHLIDQVLTLLRLEQGESTQPYEEYDIREAIAQIVVDATFEAQNSEKVVLNIPSVKPIYGSQELTGRAIENIIRNALKYSGDTGQVWINVELGKEWLKVTIADEGPGVPAEALPHLFEPFYRVEESRNQQSGGYGIGMSIAEQAIRSQGGNIVASNRSEGGLQVTICLPIKASLESRGLQYRNK